MLTFSGDKKNYHYLGTSQKLLRQSECFIMEQYRRESLFTHVEKNSSTLKKFVFTHQGLYCPAIAAFDHSQQKIWRQIHNSQVFGHTLPTLKLGQHLYYACKINLFNKLQQNYPLPNITHYVKVTLQILFTIGRHEYVIT